MGAGGSKPSQVAAEPAGVHAEKSVTSKDFKKLQKEKLEAFVGSKLIFDMSCHYFNYMQETEGMEALAKAMSANGVGFAALCGSARALRRVSPPSTRPTSRPSRTSSAFT